MAIALRAIVKTKIPGRSLLDWLRLVWLLCVSVVAVVLGASIIVGWFQIPRIEAVGTLAFLGFLVLFSLRFATLGVYADDSNLYVVNPLRSHRLRWDEVASVSLEPLPLAHLLDRTAPKVVVIETRNGKRVSIWSMVSHVTLFVPKRHEGEEYVHGIISHMRWHGDDGQG